MSTNLRRRQFVKNDLSFSCSLGALPSWAFGVSLPSGLPPIYTSIPDGFPVLDSIYKSEFIKNGFSTKVFQGPRPAPDAMLTSKFLSSNVEYGILSTLGAHLSSSDSRLSLIENVPVVGPSGAKMLNWLDDRGRVYINQCLSDWGYHAFPALIVSSTDLGWMSTRLPTPLTKVKHKSRGLVGQFFNEKGSVKLTENLNGLLGERHDHSKTGYFIQIVNSDIDVKWDPRITKYVKVGQAEARQRGALLLNFMIPTRLWQKMSSENKLRVEGCCKRSLVASYKLTQGRVGGESANSFAHTMSKEFQEFAEEIIYLESRGTSNVPLRRLFS